MKNHLPIFSIVMAASLFGATANFAAAEPESEWRGGMGPGMMGGSECETGRGMMGGCGSECETGSGMMGGHGHGMGRGMMGMEDFRGLNLSDDQKSKIMQIRKTMRTKQWTLRGDMMDAREKLEELYDADKQDAAAINKQYKVIEDLRRQMVDNSVEAHNQINSILTKEQRDKFRERGRGWGMMREH